MARPFVPGNNPFFQFFRTGQTVRRLLIIAVEGSGVTQDEYGVLSAIRALGIANGAREAPAAVQPTEMANWLGMPATTVSTYISRFVERGLVERRPNPDDRRSYVLLLSAEGNALVDSVSKRLTAVAHEVAGESPVAMSEITEALATFDAAGRRVLDSRAESR